MAMQKIKSNDQIFNSIEEFMLNLAKNGSIPKDRDIELYNQWMQQSGYIINNVKTAKQCLRYIHNLCMTSTSVLDETVRIHRGITMPEDL